MTKSKIIGIPGQNRNKNKIQEVMYKKAQLEELKRKKKNYYIGMRLEYAQKYPLKSAKIIYSFVMNQAEYPEISFWHHAAMIWLDNKDNKNIRKIDEDEISKIYNFLKYEE